MKPSSYKYLSVEKLATEIRPPEFEKIALRWQTLRNLGGSLRRGLFGRGHEFAQTEARRRGRAGLGGMSKKLRDSHQRIRRLKEQRGQAGRFSEGGRRISDQLTAEQGRLRKLRRSREHTRGGTDTLVDAHGNMRREYESLGGMLRGDISPLEVTRQRWDQGRMFGRGGLVRSWMSPRTGAWERMGENWRRGRWFGTEADPGLFRQAYRDKLLGAGMGTAFTLGYPADAAYRSIKEGDPRHFTREMGTLGGFAALGSFGMPASIAGSVLGGHLGSLGLSPDAGKPQGPQQAQPPHQRALQAHPRTQYLQQSAQRVRQPHQWQPPQHQQPMARSPSQPTRSPGLSSPHPAQGRWP